MIKRNVAYTLKGTRGSLIQMEQIPSLKWCIGFILFIAIVVDIYSNKREYSKKNVIDLWWKAIIEEFSSKMKQIHFWYFWEKQVSLTEFIHMSMGKQNFGGKNVYIAFK